MTSPRSRRSGNKQRNVSPFAMLHWMVIDSQGWHDLSLASRCAYMELVRKFDGENNGRIAMPARVLGERLNRSPAHAARALRELEDAGFIACTKQGTFRRKDRLASEYRLNVLRCDSDPPDRRWNNQKWESDSNTGEAVRWQKSALKEPTTPPQRHQRDCEGPIERSHGNTGETHIESTRGIALDGVHPDPPHAPSRVVGETPDLDPRLAAMANWEVAAKRKPWSKPNILSDEPRDFAEFPVEQGVLAA